MGGITEMGWCNVHEVGCTTISRICARGEPPQAPNQPECRDFLAKFTDQTALSHEKPVQPPPFSTDSTELSSACRSFPPLVLAPSVRHDACLETVVSSCAALAL